MAATSAPRETDSISVISRPHSIGAASAFSTAWPSRRAPSHRQGGIPSAAVRPTAFQYPNGSERRAYGSETSRDSGMIFAASA